MHEMQTKQSAKNVLRSDMTPLNKVRKLIALGYDETDADTMVSSLTANPNQMAYYERLPNPDYEEKP